MRGLRVGGGSEFRGCGWDANTKSADANRLRGCEYFKNIANAVRMEIGNMRMQIECG